MIDTNCRDEDVFGAPRVPFHVSSLWGMNAANEKWEDLGRVTQAD